MTRENVDVKARRLLQEGRLTLLRRDSDRRSAELLANVHVPVEKAPVVAECRGDSGDTYIVYFDARDNSWRCDCPARGRCAHLAALQLVTVRPREGR